MIAISWPIGTTFTALLAYGIIPNISDFELNGVTIQSWRLFLLPCSIPAFLASFIFWKYADCSPKWLMHTKHDFTQANKVLIKIAKECDSYRFIENAETLFNPQTLQSWLVKGKNYGNDPTQDLIINSEIKDINILTTNKNINDENLKSGLLFQYSVNIHSIVIYTAFCLCFYFILE